MWLLLIPVLALGAYFYERGKAVKPALTPGLGTTPQASANSSAIPVNTTDFTTVSLASIGGTAVAFAQPAVALITAALPSWGVQTGTTPGVVTASPAISLATNQSAATALAALPAGTADIWMTSNALAVAMGQATSMVLIVAVPAGVSPATAMAMVPQLPLLATSTSDAMNYTLVLFQTATLTPS